DNEGKFKESLIGDVRGLLSLYEATFLSVRQEDILDEAMEFTATRLNSALPNLSNNPIAAQLKDLVGAYLLEAKWYHEGYAPSMDEHMALALLSCGYKGLSTLALIGMGELATKEAFDWVSSFPLIIHASSVINRLMDDVAGHKFHHRLLCLRTGGVNALLRISLSARCLINPFLDLYLEVSKMEMMADGGLFIG
ncbi:hypothetical protein C3L33_22950, partial [Rhododendron williamsianum]